ncbi:PREDICTED: uncharacterized protein LOC108797449 [Nanorana parkeri]|uniref:uncharacterized protein LOC108797449 n=1 Tax=Nanorana parkeri TaxID=125878 RepID=UPI000854DD0C|nr:PREDICTED: uncharacterized protein LOC108797449 [Nanorana parkeri]
MYGVGLGSLTLCVLLQVTQGQMFMIKNVQLEKCIHAADDTGRVSLAKCKVNADHQHWTWEPSTNSIINVKSKRCLTVIKPRDLPTLKTDLCEGRKNQAWLCDSRGYLSLYGHQLHLSAKQGTKKVILSRGMDKFSKWKTMKDSPICEDVIMTTTGVQQSSPHGAEDSVDLFYESELRNSSVTLGISPFEMGTNTTTQQPKKTFTAEIEEVPSASSWEQIYVFEENSIGWKTAMLILSPFTFLLGIAILVLNVRSNKKRKLSALPSHVKPHHKLGTQYEQSPLTSKADLADYPGQDPNSSTLRHGEILIEWKDGTITPLYDQQ